jgi:hypothetical protein
MRRNRVTSMTDIIQSDAQTLRKLIREAEAVSDEAMIAMARLKQAMLAARQNPEVPVHTGQRAIMRLVQAESEAVAMSSNLFRVHSELLDIARTVGGIDDDGRSPIEGNATAPEEVRSAKAHA